MYWYVRTAMEQSGFKSTDYKVIYAYPNTVQIEQYPTIAIDKNLVRKQFFQLGGVDRTIVSLVLDVLANSRDQKDDLSLMIMDYFHETHFHLYDFTNIFPTNVGDYSGIPSLGLFSVDKVSVVTLQPPQFANVPSEKYHDMLIMEVSLPI